MTSPELFSKIRTLNEQIVTARKRGEADKVILLKAQVQRLLEQGTMATPKPDVPPKAAANASTTGPSTSETAKTSAFNIADHMQQIRELNERIVAARKQGHDSLVARLKSEVQGLLSQGSQALNTPRKNKAPTTVPVTGFTRSTMPEVDRASWVEELRALNQRLVEARRLGDETRLYQLVDKIEQWLTNEPR